MRLTSTATDNITQAMRDSGPAGMHIAHIAIDLLVYWELEVARVLMTRKKRSLPATT